MKQRFWDFSLRFYDSAEVQAAFIELQDQWGADVNLLLFLLFRAAQGYRFTDRQVRDLDGQVAGWREHTTIPLRKIRRDLKGADLKFDPAVQEELRNLVKRAELQSEKFEQERLEAIDPPDTAAIPAAEAASLNLSAYAALLGADRAHPAFAVLLRRVADLDGR